MIIDSKINKLIRNDYFYTNDGTRILNANSIGNFFNETNHGTFSTSSLSSKKALTVTQYI
jgi:hypothetical protein